jgi:adenosylhomocysteine nucleosidase
VFQQILRKWVISNVGQKVRQSAVDAARDELKNRMDDQPEQVDPKVDLVIQFALPIEAGGLVDLLDKVTVVKTAWGTVRHGVLQDRRLAIVESGAGAKLAREATLAAIDSLSPRWIISAGFAGGLQPGIERQDLILVQSILGPDGTTVDVGLNVDKGTLEPRVHFGPVISVDSPVGKPGEKAQLGKNTNALAVDMESLSVAMACRERGVGFLGGRLITDSVDQSISADIARLSEKRSTAGQFGAALGTLWNRPSSVKEMLKLKETALLGSDRLAKFLTGMIKQLLKS